MDRGDLMDNLIPRYLFHITLCKQLESIDRYGLGRENNDLYLIDFDPRNYLDSEPHHLTEDQVDQLLMIIGILLDNKSNMDIAVITINTRYLNNDRLEKDREENIWNYYDVIHQFNVDCFEISIAEREDSNFQVLPSIEFSEQLLECFGNTEHLYCRRIEWSEEEEEIENSEECEEDEEDTQSSQSSDE